MSSSRPHAQITDKNLPHQREIFCAKLIHINFVGIVDKRDKIAYYANKAKPQLNHRN